MEPLFIFSLPRSGSTLLQRVLGVTPEVSTVSEPWVLLPLYYSLKKDGVYAEYGHDCLVDAIEDVCQVLPNKAQDYHEAVAEFALSLYRKLSDPNAKYFLDKTPRYHLIVEEIIATFPNAKIIFLWRNPLAIVSSVINTWGKKGQWNLHASKIDLFDGLENLTRSYVKHENRSYAVRYEDLVCGSRDSWESLFHYLGVPYKEEYIEKFTALKLQGRLGDPTGVKNYSTLSNETTEQWKKEMTNPIRKLWCRRYLDFIGRDRLLVMGFDIDHLKEELQSVRSDMKYMFSDCVGLVYGMIYSYMEPEIFKKKYNELCQKRKIYGHH
ncbi:sulfotransferase [Mariprofundus sp. EBB-1]|uniref:sulfotransferase family protein n=1 Tax=Mariprofundus sp. EBB-1 TaxID=2650971 RepID=UPI000EF1A536|nr:sulfotransferase [Mariprofundus sp. EBB-1]RLL50647.1 sulfotransferase [Mariprofundus sp. EBB-1]